MTPNRRQVGIVDASSVISQVFAAFDVDLNLLLVEVTRAFGAEYPCTEDNGCGVLDAKDITRCARCHHVRLCGQPDHGSGLRESDTTLLQKPFTRQSLLKAEFGTCFILGRAHCRRLESRMPTVTATPWCGRRGCIYNRAVAGPQNN